ncbi:MAG: MFS transporter [Anaerolineales bacterium]
MTTSSAVTAPASRVPIYSLFTANAISMVGNVCANIAIPWFVLQTTGSAAQTGITGFFTILPVVLAGFLGGALVERIGYKPTSIIADVASGVTVALIPLLHFTIGLQFWQLMVLVFLGGLLDAPGSTARNALVPELAEMAGMQLDQATSAIQAVERGSRLVGAPLAGLLIAAIGTANVLWIDAASFAVSAAMVAIAVRVPRIILQDHVETGYFDQLRNGFRFLGGHQLILMIIAVVMITNFVDAAFGGVILPVYANQVWGSAVDLGFLIAAVGGGSVVGAILFGAFGSRVSRFSTFVAMFMLVSVLYWALAFFLPFPAILAAAIVAGIAAGPLNPIIDAVLLERIPADMRGRILGTVQAAAWLTMPLGMLVSGFLTEDFGLQPLLFALGGIYLLTTASAMFIPVLRELDVRQGPATEAAVSAEG